MKKEDFDFDLNIYIERGVYQVKVSVIAKKEVGLFNFEFGTDIKDPQNSLLEIKTMAKDKAIEFLKEAANALC